MFDDFYGLKGKPFQLTPDATFYFESGTHRKALSYLSYGLAQGEGFVVITGEVGAGKSTLVAHLMATIDPARLTAAQVVTSSLDGEEIIHVIAQAFGLLIEGHDKATALGAIEGFLHEEARAGRRCLLVVDEVQNLSISALEELRMLSNFQLGAHPLLQTLLLGQPEFRDLIQHSPQLEQLRQRVIAAHHLDAMEPAEVQPYVEHRLSKVGWQGNPSFDQRVFAELYEASGGVPRRINQIFNRLMLLGAVEERTRIDAAMLQQVLAELADDTALPLSTRRPKVAPMPAPGPISRPAPAPVPAYQAVAVAEAAPSNADFEAALAARDAQIAELQQAVLELANGSENAAPVASVASAEVDALHARIEELEARLVEQEQTVRHTLAMLVEWLEADEQIAA
ncbi:XrtA-associated ATPase [Novosphingobium sp. MW5]|nr:XrtA-associated ATPase [Novosphingobium sp. MW5]